MEKMTRQKRFLKPRALETMEGCPEKDRFSTSCVKVSCYYNGIYSVCPNPENKELSKEIDDQYNQGRFITWHAYYVPRKEFDNDSSWNFTTK